MKRNNLGRVTSDDTFIRTGTDPDTDWGADVCFLSYTRVPKEQSLPRGPLEVAPDLIIEVRSPTDRPGDVEIKVGEYLNIGVAAVVVLDPGIEAATVYRGNDELPQRFHNGDGLTLPRRAPRVRRPDPPGLRVAVTC